MSIAMPAVWTQPPTASQTTAHAARHGLHTALLGPWPKTPSSSIVTATPARTAGLSLTTPPAASTSPKTVRKPLMKSKGNRRHTWPTTDSSVSACMQHMKAHDPDVRSIPGPIANKRISEAIQKRHLALDARLSGAVTTPLQKAASKLYDELKESMVPHKDGCTKRLCDYTGINMSWSPGPRSLSLEAIYPYTSLNDRLAYHVSPNVCLAMNCLNLPKIKFPPIMLPLTATWLTSCEEIKVKPRKAKWP